MRNVYLSQMPTRILFSLFAALFLITSCGPENDAKEICACYNEVYRLSGDDGTKKMNECIQLLEKFSNKYKGTDDEKAFEDALTNCR